VSRGHDRERAVRDRYILGGWVAFRAPASLGCADVIALKAGAAPELCEVKSTTAGPFHSFGPAARLRLASAAHKAGARAFLVWWPPRKQPVWIPEKDWPKTTYVSEARVTIRRVA
jgi:Holliday junction resolvase